MSYNDPTEVNQGQQQTFILQPISVLANTASRNSSAVNFVVNMFPVPRRPLRSDQINKTPWADLQNNKLYPVLPDIRTKEPTHKMELSAPVQQENRSKTNSTTRSKECIRYMEEYFSNTMLHGLRYVGDRSLSIGERLFWICSFIGAMCCAAYFIGSLYAKYNKNPMIISLNPSATPLRTLPFPAVTICSTNNAKKSEAHAILESGADVEKLLLDSYCSVSNSSIDINSVTEEASKWENVQKFLFRVNPTIAETIKVCEWQQKQLPCEEAFNNALTDDGLCYTFNALPNSVVFKNPYSMAFLNLTYPPEVEDWNPEKGYTEHASMDALPRRARGPGTNLGFTIVLDAKTEWYYCSSVSSVGFKVLLHNPLETPKMADYALLAPPGFEARIIIEPNIFDATPSVRGIDVKKRKCYFTDERVLQFYRVYTEVNCKLECQANYTLSVCDCVPYYLPKNKFTKVCSKKKEDCAKAAKDVMEMPSESQSNCNCLPACYELGYATTATYGKLSNLFRVKEEIIRNESSDYFMTDMAVLHFYFVESQFTRNTKTVLYGFSEFLSNTGGLLGLFSGFSFISVVEIAYYLSLRLICKSIRSRTEKKRSNSKTQPKSNQISVYPFAS